MSDKLTKSSNDGEQRNVYVDLKLRHIAQDLFEIEICFEKKQLFLPHVFEMESGICRCSRHYGQMVV